MLANIPADGVTCKPGTTLFDRLCGVNPALVVDPDEEVDRPAVEVAEGERGQIADFRARAGFGSTLLVDQHRALNARAAGFDEVETDAVGRVEPNPALARKPAVPAAIPPLELYQLRLRELATRLQPCRQIFRRRDGDRIR